MNARKVRIRESSWIARIAARKLRAARMAMVIGHTIHLHNVARDAFLSSERWLCHELRHVAQYEQYGTLGFLLRYLWESLRKGYHANRFEAEARAAEADLSLLKRYEIE